MVFFFTFGLSIFVISYKILHKLLFSVLWIAAVLSGTVIFIFSSMAVTQYHETFLSGWTWHLAIVPCSWEWPSRCVAAYKWGWCWEVCFFSRINIVVRISGRRYAHNQNEVDENKVFKDTKKWLKECKWKQHRQWD